MSRFPGRGAALICVLVAGGVGAGCNPPASQPSGAVPAAAPDDAGSEAVVDAAEARRLAPRVDVPEPIHMFGRMSQGESGTHVFRFGNSGKSPLKISKSKTSCKCTVANLPKLELQPGETMDVTITWKIEDPAPMFKQYAFLATNDPDTPEVQLTIEGEAVPRLVLTPSGRWEFPDLQGTKPLKASATLTSSVADGWQITRLESSDPQLVVTAQPMTPDELQTAGLKAGFKLDAVLTPTAEVPRFSATLVVATDLPDGPEFQLAVEASRPPPFTMLGPRWTEIGSGLNLGRFRRQDGAETIAYLFVNGGPEDLTFEVREIEPPHVQFAIEPAPLDKPVPGRRRYKVTIRVPPNGPSESFSLKKPGSVRLRTNHPEKEKYGFGLYYIAF